MRIALMLESDGPGGAEQVVLHLAEELCARGHEVLHVGPKNGVGWLGAELRKRGIATVEMSPRGPLDMGFVQRLVGMLREHRIELVHSHEFTMAFFGALACRRISLPHIITLHGGTRLTAAVRRRLAIRFAMMLSQATVAVSDAWRRQLGESLRVSLRRIITVHNGAASNPGDRSATRERLGILPEEQLILAVGNLEPWKGHRLLVRAVSAVGGRTKLVIAGGRGGSDHEAVLEDGRALHDAGRFQILLNRNDIPDLLAASDIFAMPSTFEGLPMAMLEAMLAGKAIVASRIGGIPEAIDDGIHGLLVPPGDTESLTLALDRLCTDADLRLSLGAAARARADACFTIEAMTTSYEELYRQHARRRST